MPYRQIVDQALEINTAPTNSLTRRHLHISGVVQGVGFRPFLHNLAYELGLNGWVRNTSTGVELELQGATLQLDRFMARLKNDAPPQCHGSGTYRRS